MSKIKTTLRNFFFPPRGSPRWMFILPYAVLGVLTLLVLVGGAYAWDYTNSPAFCGTTCHTMPPEYAAYEVSPHARISCVECHIGREFIGNQIFRKAGDLRHVFATIFVSYEYPIRATNMRPAPEICEKCHSPEKFSDDSLRLITHYNDDLTPYYIYLILKTGGGSKREGMGRGIHWHIENPVYYYPTDEIEQTIPYVRVVQDDGTIVEYVDIETDFDPATIDESQLKQMDCITCHNRITHRVYLPEESLDHVLALGKISTDIPEIRTKAIEVLRREYASQEEGLKVIAALDSYYQMYHSDFYLANESKIAEAIAVVQQIYIDSVYLEQKVDWDSHPNNVGHINSPGCFRCHDGKHLDAQQQAIRLECNICHSIPVVVDSDAFIANIEISRGPEPESHLNPNWIILHRDVFDQTCVNCHTTDNPGGITNTSFCSNSACHGSAYTYAGFDAPGLRILLQAQLPPPKTAELPPVIGTPTYDANIGPLLAAKCTVCHGATASAGLDLTTYTSTLKGGDDGAIIIVSDSTGSKLVKVQSESHFAKFSPEELDLVKRWIDAGAPEK